MHNREIYKAYNTVAEAKEAITKHSTDVLNFLAKHINKDKDFLQEAYANILHRIDSYKPGNNLGPWIYQCGVNSNRALFNKNTTEQSRLSQIYDTTVGIVSSPLDDLIQKEDATRLRECLAQVNDRDKFILTKIIVDEWTLEQVAESTGLSFQRVHQIVTELPKKLCRKIHGKSRIAVVE